MSTCRDALGTRVMIVLIMPLRLVHLALFPVTRWPLAGFCHNLDKLACCGDFSEVLETCVTLKL